MKENIKLFAISAVEDLRAPERKESVADGTAAKPGRMVFYAGASIYRYDFWSDTEYMLQFDMSPAAVDLSRLNAGAPLMADHNRPRSVDKQVGIVEKAWLESGKGFAEYRLADTPDMENFRAKVEQKIYRNISMEAQVDWSAIKDQTPKGSKMKHLLATRWYPEAISFVPAGADPGAQLLAEAEGSQDIWLAAGIYQPRQSPEPEPEPTKPNFAQMQSLLLMRRRLMAS